MSLDEQQERLIALVREYRERECAAALARARERVAEMLKEAHAEARRRVHSAAESERARAAARIRSAEADLHTRQRARAQGAAATLLDEGRDRLRERLAGAWTGPEDRAAWLRTAAGVALRRLPPGAWRVAHPQAWDGADAATFSDALPEQMRGTLSFQPEADLEAGVVIHSGRTVLDMSLGGLLADQRMIESRLLALMNRSRSR
jgi:hypothetical protein